MSWKGFQKGIVRTPQSLLNKINHAPKDPLHEDVHQRFTDIETQVKHLHSESKRYHEAIGRLLHHQSEFAGLLGQMAQPITGRYIVAEGESNDDPSSSPETAAAVEQFRAMVAKLQETIRPELEMIEMRILKPADDLLLIIESVKKMLTKREHKRLDLERHEQSLRKHQDRNERSVRQEEKLYKVEQEYEMALQEYSYYNDLLKTELPKLFRMEGDFIRPLFQTLYYLQLSIYYTMHSHMQEMKSARFNLSGEGSNIVSDFHAVHDELDARAANIPITHFRQSAPQQKLEKLRLSRTGKSGSSDEFGSASPSPPPPEYSRIVPPRHTRHERGPSSGYDDEYGDHDDPYEEEAPPAKPARRPARPGPAMSSRDEAPPPPRPARPRRPDANAPPVEFCTALYDFDAQSPGDLSFREGDRIEIVKRTEKAEGWWTGRLHGEEGTFPGNYVELN